MGPGSGRADDALRNSSRVNAVRARLEGEVEDGELSALEAADQILVAFASDVPALWPTRAPETPGFAGRVRWIGEGAFSATGPGRSGPGPTS